MTTSTIRHAGSELDRALRVVREKRLAGQVVSETEYYAAYNSHSGWRDQQAVNARIQGNDNPGRSPQPSIEQLIQWEAEGGCEATDGCWVEPDGRCEHGKPSWLLALGMI